MRKLYRLSFNNKNQWLRKRNKLVKADEDGNYPSKAIDTFQLLTGETITINEVGEVPSKVRYDKDGNLKPPNYLDNDGNIVNVKHTDFAVDVITDVLIPKLDKYVIDNQWYHNSFTGATETPQITIKPESSWKKSEIQQYLDDNNIVYTKSMSKDKLLELCE